MKQPPATPSSGSSCLLPLAAVLSALPGRRRRPRRAKAEQFTLANGLTLIVKPDRRAPTAVHMLWVRVGSMDEVDGTSGVAHVLEHMMFKGTHELKPGEFSRRVAALGGRENAFTTRDATGYYQQIPADKLEDVMKLEADRFANNQWPDEEFKRETRGGEGGAPPAHRGLAARAAVGAAERRRSSRPRPTAGRSSAG